METLRNRLRQYPLVFIRAPTYVALPLPDWKTLRRLRTEGGCPQPVPGENSTYTVIVTVRDDGTHGDAICGWVGHLYDMPSQAWFWDGVVPWLAVTTAFITTPGTSASWSVPADWDSSNNTVEAIGSGVTPTGVPGGGAGAYAKQTNVTLTPGGTATYTINLGADTMFVTAGTLLAKSGSGATGGAAASCFPTSGAFSGGAGAGSSNQGGGGGGGAGGPDGAGKAGGVGGIVNGAGGGGSDGGSSTAGAVGGSGSGGAGGAGNVGSGGGVAPGGAGTAGTGGGGAGSGSGNGGAGATGKTSWTATVGGATAGGGGGGGGHFNGSFTAGAGGLYGGGGGGGNSTRGLGKQGIIVPVYTPSVAASLFPPWLPPGFLQLGA